MEYVLVGLRIHGVSTMCETITKVEVLCTPPVTSHQVLWRLVYLPALTNI